MLNPRKLYNKKGFSLVELIIVVAIIAIISVASIAIAPGLVEKARKSTAESKLTEIQTLITTTAADPDVADLYTKLDDEKAANGITGVEAVDDLDNLDISSYDLKNKVCIIFHKGDDFVIACFYGKTTGKCVILDSRDLTREYDYEVAAYFE